MLTGKTARIGSMIAAGALAAGGIVAASPTMAEAGSCKGEADADLQTYYSYGGQMTVLTGKINSCDAEELLELKKGAADVTSAANKVFGKKNVYAGTATGLADAVAQISSTRFEQCVREGTGVTLIDSNGITIECSAQ